MTRQNFKYLPLVKLVPMIMMCLFWTSFMVIAHLILIIRKGWGKVFYIKKRTMPECLRDPVYGDHKYIRLHDIRLHCVISGPETAPLMVFLHGFPEFWYSWRHQIKEFSKDYRVVAVDMRGYNESDKPKGFANYHLDILCKDIQELVHALEREKCTLVSHDWGGIVAFGVALRFPECVERLVVCNAPHPIAAQRQVETSLKQILMSWYIFFFQFPLIPEYVFLSEDVGKIEAAFRENKRGTFTENDLECYKYALGTKEKMTGPINYYRALRYDAPLRDYRVHVPTLIVWGEKDAYISKEIAVNSCKYIDNYKLKFIDASHWVQTEQPTQVNDAIREFMRQKI